MARATCNHSQHHCCFFLFSALALQQHIMQRDYLERSMTSAKHCCHAGSRHFPRGGNRATRSKQFMR
eukprot:10093960-Alexandrium_andersonii.AAC.1